MAPVQRDGFEYEFDVMMDMDMENVGRVQKTRCPALTGTAFVKPGADVAGILREWLTGAAPEQAPPPVVFTPPSSAKAVQSESPPVYDATRTYADGSPVDANAKAVETYDAYVAAHDGKAPDNVHNLRNWYKSQKNGNGNPAPASQVDTTATQPALVTDDTAAEAATATAEGLFD
jgi:hypothetical protein